MNPDKLPKPKKKPAPVTRESEEVRAAGQAQLSEMRKKSGRGDTFFSNPAMKTGFTGIYGQKTGSV